MKGNWETTVGAVAVTGHVVGYLYLVRDTDDREVSFWRFVENKSCASYSNEDLVLLLGLVKSALRVRQPDRLEVIAIAP